MAIEMAGVAAELAPPFGEDYYENAVTDFNCKYDNATLN
jgi:hypothetical protein